MSTKTLSTATQLHLLCLGYLVRHETAQNNQSYLRRITQGSQSKYDIATAAGIFIKVFAIHFANVNEP
jgi:hypothetical protein